MQSIPTLLENIIEDLRSNQALADELGIDGIQYYSDPAFRFKCLEDAIDSMEPPSLLLAHDSSELENAGPWIHRFHLILRADRPDHYWSLISIIIDGKIGDYPWVAKDVNEFTEPPSDIEVGKLTNEDGIEFYRLGFSVRERIW